MRIVDDDPPRPVKVHKLEVLIVDHDGLGPDEIKQVLENARYPNHCMSPDVIRIETRQVDWTDEHPLNSTLEERWRPAYEALFAKGQTGG